MVNIISSGCAKSNGRLCIGLLIAIILYYSFLNNLDTITSLFLTIIISSIASLTNFCHDKSKLITTHCIVENLNEFENVRKLRKLKLKVDMTNDNSNKNSDNNFSLNLSKSSSKKFVNKNVILCKFYNKILCNNDDIDKSYPKTTAIGHRSVKNIIQSPFRYFSRRLLTLVTLTNVHIVNNL